MTDIEKVEFDATDSKSVTLSGDKIKGVICHSMVTIGDTGFCHLRLVMNLLLIKFFHALEAEPSDHSLTLTVNGHDFQSLISIVLHDKLDVEPTIEVVFLAECGIEEALRHEAAGGKRTA